MAKISKRILNKDLEEHIFELFVKTVTDLKDSNDVKDFLEDLLSPIEKIMLMKRLAIAILLSKGHTYDSIDNTLKVSRPTIMSVSYSLKYGKAGYQKAVNKIIKGQKIEGLLDKVEEILLSLSMPKRYESWGYEQKKKAGIKLAKRKRLRERL